MKRNSSRLPSPAKQRTGRRGALSGAASPVRTQRERTETSKRKLLAAALELVAERGYRGASLVAIGERAGYSRGLVTEHFGSKEGLLRELVSRLMSGWRSGVVAEDVGDQRGAAAFTAFVRAHRRAVKENPAAVRALYVLLFESLLEQSSLREEFQAMDAVLRQLAREYLTAGQKAGTVRSDVDAEAQAALAIAAVRGVTLQWMVDPDALDLDRVYGELARWMDRGLRAESPPRSRRPRAGEKRRARSS